MINTINTSKSRTGSIMVW